MRKIITEYLSDPTLTPMEGGKIRSILTRQQGFSGVVMPRYQYAESRVAAGNVQLDDRRQQYINTETSTHYSYKDVTLALVCYTDWLMKRKEKQHGTR